MCLSCVQGAWLGSPCDCLLGQGARLGASFSLDLLSFEAHVWLCSGMVFT